MRTLALSALLLLCACDRGPTREELTERVDQLDAENQELRSKVDDLTTQLEEAREAVGRVSRAADEVQSNAERFSSENWRSVVPDVEDASDELDDARREAAEAVEEQ